MHLTTIQNTTAMLVIMHCPTNKPPEIVALTAAILLNPSSITPQPRSTVTMYLGQHETRINIYLDKTIASGVRYVKLHHYQCESCGRIAKVTFQAEESFYCGDCNTLIDLNGPGT